MWKLASIALCAGLLVGCSTVKLPSAIDQTAQVRSACAQPGSDDWSTTNGQLCRVATLVVSHTKDARRLELERGAYNLITLAAAITGATALGFQAHNDVVLGAALTAGGAQALNAYGSPGAKQTLLFKAIDRLGCMRRAVRVAVSPAGTVADLDHFHDIKIAELLGDAVDTVETTLMKSWIDASPDLEFGTVLGNISSTVNVDTATEDGVEINLEQLALRLAECATE